MQHNICWSRLMMLIRKYKYDKKMQKLCYRLLGRLVQRKLSIWLQLVTKIKSKIII